MYRRRYLPIIDYNVEKHEKKLSQTNRLLQFIHLTTSWTIEHHRVMYWTKNNNYLTNF